MMHSLCLEVNRRNRWYTTGRQGLYGVRDMDEGISKAVGCLSALAILLIIVPVLGAKYCERMQTVTGNGLGVVTCQSNIMQGMLDLIYWVF
jgi:hypothetical protein